MRRHHSARVDEWNRKKYWRLREQLLCVTCAVRAAVPKRARCAACQLRHNEAESRRRKGACRRVELRVDGCVALAAQHVKRAEWRLVTPVEACTPGTPAHRVACVVELDGPKTLRACGPAAAHAQLGEIAAAAGLRLAPAGGAQR